MLKQALNKATHSLLTMPKAFFHVPYKTEKRINLLDDCDLFNCYYVKKLVNSEFPGVTKRSQRGLFHGAKERSGERTCFSEKKSKHLFKPNVFKKMYYSEILERSFEIDVSTTAIKSIRSHGGFDNYILLCKPQQMQSMYGEYLRRLMYRKLNDPEFNTKDGNIYGAFTSKTKTKVRTEIFRYATYSKELRHKDLSAINPDFFDEMTKKERKLAKRAFDDPENAHEILKEDPLYLQEIEDMKKNLKEIIPLANQAKQEVENMADKKYLRLYKLQHYDAVRQGLTHTENAYEEYLKSDSEK